MTATANDALQRTAPARHGNCFRRRLSTHRAGAAQCSAVAELGVISRCSPLDIVENAEHSPSMKITEAKAVDCFHVFLRFDDGASGSVDLSHFAGRGVFRAWQQEGVFEQLSISPAGALQWPEDLDLCPDPLYLHMVGKSAAEVFPALHDSLAHA